MEDFSLEAYVEWKKTTLWKLQIGSNGWNEWDNLICPFCHTRFDKVDEPQIWNYCPCCGKDMRGENK